MPAIMKQAILAAEDERFYTHGGVNTLGVLRAAYSNFIGGGKAQGVNHHHAGGTQLLPVKRKDAFAQNL